MIKRVEMSYAVHVRGQKMNHNSSDFRKSYNS